MKIDEKAIKHLADLLNETGLTEIEVADGDKVIRISKGGTIIANTGTPAITMPSDPTLPQKASLDAPDNIASSHSGAIKSPMVGTVYLKPDSNSPEFVKKGDNVNAGDTLLIIEAMKVMNPIKAEKSGTITQILAKNAQPIEFGDVLLVIE